MAFAHPEYLVETGWLAQHLTDSDLRILDCTVFLRRDPERGLRIESGRAAWAEGHIPGSAFADLHVDLSDTTQALRFMMPPAEQFAAAMSRYGVGEGTRVVLYDRAFSMWAARVWWMLRAFGFDDAAVLNGGWKKWTREGRPTSTTAPAYPPGRFVPRPRPALMVGKQEVLAALGDSRACILNALSEEQHRGQDATYGRRGHIPGAVNVPAMSLVDAETGAYLPADVLRRRFEAVGATRAGRVITYCGGGIAASSDAFVLALLGHDGVAVYDASLSEWAADPSLPLEVS